MTTEAGLDQALITRFCTSGRVKTRFLLRSDKGLVFTQPGYTTLVRSYRRSPRRGYEQRVARDHRSLVGGLVAVLESDAIDRGHQRGTAAPADRLAAGLGHWPGRGELGALSRALIRLQHVGAL